MHTGKEARHVKKVPRAGRLRVVVLVAQWHTAITAALQEACIQTLREAGIKKKNIYHFHVPGSFELPAAAAMAMRQLKPDGIICLGCIVKGETRHHEYIAYAVAMGLQQLNTSGCCPVVFGVLTTDNLEQAVARSGGNRGNKGEEAARALMELMRLRQQMQKNR
ncbi:MAG: 6,7-dimethyl-8-ribityllumazine synthase [Chitinophagales bacterium]|nr:6,7-dimethyl-8-ribityllumazine synthase [Chitinophagales bacterium]MDW8428758.1 6,7-dimethyl-8-ribityllumazine synthase [Chitinophagales bacterium]